MAVALEEQLDQSLILSLLLFKRIGNYIQSNSNNSGDYSGFEMILVPFYPVGVWFICIFSVLLNHWIEIQEIQVTASPPNKGTTLRTAGASASDAAGICMMTTLVPVGRRRSCVASLEKFDKFNTKST